MIERPELFAPLHRLSDCRRAQPAIFEMVKSYPIIFISSDWLYYHKRSDQFIPTFSGTLDTLMDSGARVILIGKAPTFPEYDRHCAEKSLSLPNMDCSVADQPLDQDIVTINRRLALLADQYDTVDYIDFNAALSAQITSALFTNRMVVFAILIRDISR